ncbi:MAG: hypothetical protein U0470_03490 [Anaerolineae bacterium]
MNDFIGTADRRRRRFGLLAALAVAALAVSAGALPRLAPRLRPDRRLVVRRDGRRRLCSLRRVGGRPVRRRLVRRQSGSEGIVNPTTGIADGMFIFPPRPRRVPRQEPRPPAGPAAPQQPAALLPPAVPARELRRDPCQRDHDPRHV